MTAIEQLIEQWRKAGPYSYRPQRQQSRRECADELAAALAQDRAQQDAVIVAAEAVWNAVWNAVEATPDHTEWFKPLGNLKAALEGRAQPIEASPDRLRALARDAAWEAHEAARAIDDEFHPATMFEFDQCPHPDCILVREAPRQEPTHGKD